MNRETHEPEIEVELLDPEKIESQEKEIDFSALSLDGDLIEELYQEQKQERQAVETQKAEGQNPAMKKTSESNATDETAAEVKKMPEEEPSEKDPVDEAAAPEKASVDEAVVTGKGASEEQELTDSVPSSEAAAADPNEAVAAEEELPEIILPMDLQDELDFTGEITLDEKELAETEFPETDGEGEGSGEDTDAEEEPAKGKKKSLFRRILKGVLITLEVLVLVFIVYVVTIIVQADSTTDLLSRLSQSLLGKTVLSVAIQEEYESNVQETIDSEQISTNEGLDVTPYTLEGDYTSFVIFGVDAREDEFDSGTNSDTIIIVTIQNETGRVRMASIYRDTYLQIESNNGSVHYAKANSAYSSGGAVRALNMLNTNFDLALEDYVVVNFTGVADIIDELGGLDITLSEGEVSQLNYHLAGSIKATGLTADKITSAGLNHLNGVQALTYARIRKTAFTDPDTGEVYNNDYGRTKRQQYVISLLAEKAKTASVSELTAIVNRVFSYNTDEEKVIGTTYAFDDIISMIPLALDFTLDGGEGYPDNKTTMVMSDLNGADCVIATDLASDVTALHEFLYDEEDYSPTAAVRNIADTILERAATYGTED